MSPIYSSAHLGWLVAAMASAAIVACTSKPEIPTKLTPKLAPTPVSSSNPPSARVQETFETFDQAAFHDLVIAPDGDIVAVGSATRGITLGEQTHRQRGSGANILLARFSPDGVVRWSHLFGGRATQRGDLITLLPDGDIAIAGQWAMVLKFDDKAEPPPYAGRFDLFVARFSPTGDFRWNKAFGGPLSEVAEGLVAREDGSLVLGGWFSKSFALGGPKLQAKDQVDGFLAHLSGDGSHIRSMSFGGKGSQKLTGLAQHVSGDLIIAGLFEKSLDLKNVHMVTGVGDPTAKPQESQADPAGKQPPVPAAAPAPTPELRTAETTTTGSIKPAATTSPLHTSGYPNLFIARLTPEFELRWNRSFGTPSHRRTLVGVETTAAGEIIVAGTYENTLDLGHGEMPATGLDDAYVARLAGDGTPAWQWSQGLAQESVVIEHLDVRRDGEVVLAGYAEDAQAPFPLLARIASGGATRWPLTQELWPNEQRATSIAWSAKSELVVATVVEHVIEVPPGGNPAPIPVLKHLRIRVLPADPTTPSRP